MLGKAFSVSATDWLGSFKTSRRGFRFSLLLIFTFFTKYKYKTKEIFAPKVQRKRWRKGGKKEGKEDGGREGGRKENEHGDRSRKIIMVNITLF